MTELDPNIILKAFNAPQIDLAGPLERQDAMQQRNVMRQRADVAYNQQQSALAKQQAAEARRQQIGQQYGSGDAAGANKAALAAGDFDLVKQLGQMDDDSRKRAFDVSQRTAPLLLSLKNVPPEGIQSALTQMAPQLQAAGFTPEHIQQVGAQLADPAQRDAAFGSILSSAQTIADYQKQNEPYTLSPGEHRFVGGKEVASVAAEPRFILDPVTGKTVQVGGPGVGSPPSGGGSIPFSALISAESGGKQFGPNGQPLTSPKGAVGIAQVMPATAPEAARMAGLQWDPNRYRNDPAYNQQIGAAYYSSLQQRYGNDVQAAAAYNAGMGRVDAAIKSGGANWLQALPRETQNYVARLSGGHGGAPQRGVDGVPREAPPSGYRWKADGGLEPIPGGPGDKQVALPRVPPATVNAYVANNASMRKIAAAKKAVESYKGAVGAWNSVTPDFVAQRTDPKGVKARALIADIGSMIIHDRSGAAVTASETPRLKPFIPTVSDTPETIGNKLDSFLAALEETQQDYRDAYSNENGDSMLTKVGKRNAPKPASGAAARIASDADYVKLPPGAMFVGPDGHTRRKP